jgi:MFS transporter, PPP family, 3-phenylpropionic acid transporter
VGFVLQKAGLSWMFYGYFGIMVVLLAIVIGFMPARRSYSHATMSWNLRDLVGQRAWLFFFASMIPLWMANNGTYTFLGIYLKEMGASESLIGFNSSIAAISELPAMLFGALLISRMGLKRMLWVAYLMYAVRYFLYSVIPSPGWALVVSCMHGVTFGLFWVSTNVYLSRLSPLHLRTTNQTIWAATMAMAGVIGAPISGWVFDNMGPAWLFKLFSVLCLVALGVLLMGFRGERGVMGEKAMGDEG